MKISSSRCGSGSSPFCQACVSFTPWQLLCLRRSHTLHRGRPRTQRPAPQKMVKSRGQGAEGVRLSPLVQTKGVRVGAQRTLGGLAIMRETHHGMDMWLSLLALCLRVGTQEGGASAEFL
jgi:hypothetical protein